MKAHLGLFAILFKTGTQPGKGPSWGLRGRWRSGTTQKAILGGSMVPKDFLGSPVHPLFFTVPTHDMTR